MIELLVPIAFNNKRIDTFLFETLTNIPSSVIFKAFRKKDVRVNNKKVSSSYLVLSGDKVQLYIALDNSEKPISTTIHETLKPAIIYEDQNIIIVSKPQGIPVQMDKNHDKRVLDIWVRDYFNKRDSHYKDGFPALCHRLDRNTGGLVLFAKDQASLRILENKFRSHEIVRIYHCIVNGIPSKDSAQLHSYLRKDSKRSLVFISDKPIKGSDDIVTRYKVLKSVGNMSVLEVELITGKTHQIRAHLAHIGHPILGDGKYGINQVNRECKLKWQALWSTEITFMFTTFSGHLDYLSQKTIKLPKINWEKELTNTIH